MSSTLDRLRELRRRRPIQSSPPAANPPPPPEPPPINGAVEMTPFQEWCRTRVKHPSEFDDADRAVLKWIDDGCPVYRPPEPASKYGGPDGWTAPAWRERLLQLANLCEAINPDRAAELREEAKRFPGNRY